MRAEETGFNKISNSIYLSILLLCCLVAYWPLTFQLFSLKNDALNYFLPVRHQISEAIYNGYWPFWSPYFNLGYPLHGDMQSGVWNPFVQLFSLAGPYTLRTLQYETLLYVFISGIGMFYLLRHFVTDKLICLSGAAAFMLCGYNSDSAQFLNWICSASFIPFVFLFYYKTLTEPSTRSAIFCSFFLYLLFVCAYPADFILTCYLLFAIFIWHLFDRNNRLKKLLIPQVKLHLLLSVCFILLSLPAIFSFIEYLPLTERGSGTSYEQALSNPLHPKLLFSYLAPLAIWKANGVGITDPLERNSFIGIVTFCLILYSFLLKTDNKLLRFAKWAFVAFTLFSFGAMGILRSVAYYILPLMDSFRHPANAKIFTLFFGCLIASITLQHYTPERNFLLKKVSFYILILLLVLFGLWALAGKLSLFSDFYITVLKGGNSFGQKLKTVLEAVSFSDLLFINIIIQIPFIIALYYFFVKKLKLKYLVGITLLNGVLHTMLFQPFTVVKKDSVGAIQNVINKVSVPGYPLPVINNTLDQNSLSGHTYFEEIGTANMYNKKIGRIDYRISPSNLLNQNKFWFNNKIQKLFFSYPIFYRADTAFLTADSVAALSTKTKRLVLLEDEKLVNKINSNKAESIHSKAEFTKFTPNEWIMKVTADQPGFYCLFQNYYPRWTLHIDKKQVPIQKTNISFMGFALPSGDHEIVFSYGATDIKVAYLISLIATVLVLLLAFVNNKN